MNNDRSEKIKGMISDQIRKKKEIEVVDFSNRLVVKDQCRILKNLQNAVSKQEKKLRAMGKTEGFELTYDGKFRAQYQYHPPASVGKDLELASRLQQLGDLTGAKKLRDKVVKQYKLDSVI